MLMNLRQKGQGMTEYIVIVALIAVAAIGVYQLFGGTVRSQTAGIAQEVAGASSQTSTDTAVNRGLAAETEGQAVKSLSNFNNDTARTQ